MLYNAYQAASDAMGPLRALAAMQAEGLRALPPGLAGNSHVRRWLATSEVLSTWGPTHRRPSFGIDSVLVDGVDVPVREERVHSTPFGTLLRFAKEVDAPQPAVLVVAPLSGHFATLLRDTVRTLLIDHDVHITDWHNGRDIALRHGPFGLDEYIQHLIDFLGVMGPDAHLLGICQPTVPALAAAALMAEDGHRATPRSLTLVAGPVDARINPTEVNDFATSRSLEWFERNVITTVPWRYAGAMRRVYPGFLQLTAFMSMNFDRHLSALRRMHHALSQGDHMSAAKTKAFYEEYFAVLDICAEFYLDTVRAIFQDHDLALGRLEWKSRAVQPRALRAPLLTVEGERDDICGRGQTLAAHDLCTGVPRADRRHHLQSGVGHYGIFSGSRWETQVYPVVRDHIRAASD